MAWGREVAKLDHTMRLIATQYVKPYVRRQKNDMADAEAIAEAASHPTMRFVGVKQHIGRKCGSKLKFGAVIRAAERGRAIRVSELERRQMRAAREELDHEREAQERARYDQLSPRNLHEDFQHILDLPAPAATGIGLCFPPRTHPQPGIPITLDLTRKIQLRLGSID